MSCNTRTNLIEQQKVYACTDAACASDIEADSPAAVRDLFTAQTGQALITIGKMFVNVPPFNDHIDHNTGQMLISIGRKLKRK